ncbi:hypothetical protein [Bradyrhizobium australiense]
MKDDRSALIRLERFRIWERNKSATMPATIWLLALTTVFFVSIART